MYAGVREAQRAGHLAQDGDRLVDRERAGPFELPTEGLALDERHHVVEEPLGLARVEQRHDMRVCQVRGDPDLAEEPLRAQGGGELRPEDLDRHLAVVPLVAREVDRRHAALPELTLDVITAGQGGSDPVDGAEHGERT